MEGRTDIGGFFGLELPEYGNALPWRSVRSVAVNSGRHALEYILRRLGDVHCVHVPLYTCRTVLEPMERLHISVASYRIDERLELEELPDLREGECLLYTNYFGIKEKYVDMLASRYGGRLIVDNALALYSAARPGVSCLYSPRKFSGLPDGGIAVMDAGTPLPEPEERDESMPEAAFLLEYLEHGPEGACAACERSERRLRNAPLRRMSRLTERLMRGIDYEQARLRRMDNFLFLHERLGSLNRLSVETDSLSAPFCYPFWTAFPELRNVLIDERILVPLLWPEVLEQAPADSLERKLARHLLPLPVDQRCGPQDMERIARSVEEFYS